MARRNTSTFRGPGERKSEYLIAMENKDRPQWDPDKLENMKKHFDSVVDDLAKLDECVINVSPDLGIPSHRRLDMMRIVRRAWKLVRKKVPRNQYIAEVTFFVTKYGFDIGTTNRVLSACGLPTIA